MSNHLTTSLISEAAAIMDALMLKSDCAQDRNAEFAAVSAWKIKAGGGTPLLQPIEALTSAPSDMIGDKALLAAHNLRLTLVEVNKALDGNRNRVTVPGVGFPVAVEPTDAQMLEWLLTHQTIHHAGGLWIYFRTSDEFVNGNDHGASVRAAIRAAMGARREWLREGSLVGREPDSDRRAEPEGQEPGRNGAPKESSPRREV